MANNKPRMSAGDIEPPGPGTRIAALPKITTPDMSSCVPRPVLFACFDAHASVPLLWISAPAGYGKTTAVSSYLRTRHRPTGWYHCDEGDEDVASFFHYAALARRALGVSVSLPVFLPQHLSAVPVFCRNFFRGWFADLPSGTVFVLDNWQDVPVGSALRDLLPVIAEQMPPRMQLIVISRNEPDASVSRLIVGERLAQVGIEDLKLSPLEIGAIARSRLSEQPASPPVDVDALFAATQGWAAAVTLLLRRGGAMHPLARTGPHGGESQAIFDYLAVEVFERLEHRVQEFLLALVCLDHIAASVAERISGCRDAGSLLENLVRQNVFTSYRCVSDSYHFHPLFRGFLQRRLEAVRPEERRFELLLDSAAALIAEDNAEDGIRLLIQARAWSEAGQLIRTVAAAFVDQARLATLSQWIESLPASFVADDAWLLYWRGVCRLTLDFPSARADLERSYHGFLATSSRSGQALACAGVLHHIAYMYSDYRDMLPWIERLEGILAADAPQFDALRTELTVRAAFMLALSQAIPNHPGLADSVARVAALVNAELDVVSTAEGVSALLHFFARFGRTPQYGALDALIDRLLDDPELTPLHRLNLLWLHAYQLHSSGDPAKVIAILGEARALARQEGLYSDDTRMQLCELQAQETDLSLAKALATFCELEPHVRSMPEIPRAHFLYVRSIFELGCGNLEQALVYGEQALPLIRASHWYIGEALSLTGLAEVYCAAGRLEEASRCIEECALITRGVNAPLVEFNLALARAELARCQRDGAAFEAALSNAFAVGREQAYANGFHTSSQLLRRLVPYGLELGIEPSYCRWVIAKRRFPPPSSHRACWPWPVKIRALGRLRIYVEDVELEVQGKAQRKPLEVLKLLTAHPDGLGAARIMDEVWPDLDGDAARNALDIALHRLRKILRSKEALLLISGNLALNKDVVWLDTGALEGVPNVPTGAGTLLDAREELFELYRGGLLRDEPLGGAMLIARGRLRRKFVRRVSQLAKELENCHQWDEAASLYTNAIECEPSEESLHLGLSRALEARRSGHSVNWGAIRTS